MAEEQFPHIVLPEYEGPERRRTYQCFCHPKHQKAITTLEKRMDKNEDRLGGTVPWKIFIPIMAPLMLLFVAALWGIFDKISQINADMAALNTRAITTEERVERTNNKIDKLHDQIETIKVEMRKLNGHHKAGEAGG